MLSHSHVVSDGPPPPPKAHHADPTHVHGHPHTGAQPQRTGFGLA